MQNWKIGMNRQKAVLLALALAATTAEAEGVADEMVAALSEQCLPLVTTGEFAQTALSEVPSFLARNFFEILGAEGQMYQLSPEGDVRILVPVDRTTCIAYQQTEMIEELLAGVDEWREVVGFTGEMPDLEAEKTSAILRSEDVEISIEWLEKRLYAIFRVSKAE